MWLRSFEEAVRRSKFHNKVGFTMIKGFFYLPTHSSLKMYHNDFYPEKLPVFVLRSQKLPRDPYHAKEKVETFFITFGQSLTLFRQLSLEWTWKVQKEC